MSYILIRCVLMDKKIESSYTTQRDGDTEEKKRTLLLERVRRPYRFRINEQNFTKFRINFVQLEVI